MEVKSFDQIYSDMRNYIIAHQDKLTDFNDGGVLASQIEATARELALLYIQCRVGYSSFLRSLPYSVFDFAMNDGLKASTEIVLSRSKPLSHESAIRSGTIVAAGGLNFITTKESAIPSGAADSPLISAVAQNIGDKYNVGAGAIKTIVSELPTDVVSVNNPVPATGGEDSEDWAAYEERFAEYILGLQRTNSAGLISGLSGERLIRSMGMEEHFPPLDGLWNITFYLEDGSGGMTQEALAKAKKIIDGDISKGIGGFRAPGVNIRYLAPQIVPVAIHVTVTAERDIVDEINLPIITNDVADEMRKYINSLKIGKSVLISDLTVILKRMPSLSNVRVTYPANDIEIHPANQIARFEDCNVTVIA